MIQYFHVILSYTHAQKCLHWYFPGKKSLLLRSVTWKRGRHSRHGVWRLWKKGGEKSAVFGENSDLVSLESQTNGERKTTPWEDLKSQPGMCSLVLEMGRSEVWGPRREVIKWSIKLSKLKEKRCKVGKWKVACEHQARDSAGPELGQAFGERIGICFLWLWEPRAGSL